MECLVQGSPVVHNMVHNMTLENTSQYVGLERPMTFFYAWPHTWNRSVRC